MVEELRKELYDLAKSIDNLSVLEYTFVKSAISTVKKSLNKISVEEGDLNATKTN